MKKSVQETYLESKVAEHTLYSLCPVTGRRLSLAQHNKSARLRKDMSRQMLYRNTFGLMNDQQHRDEIKNTVEHEFSFMKLDMIEGDADQRDKLVEVFVKYFPDLNSVFKNYCAFSDSGSTASMSFSDFCHMLEHCNMFDGKINHIYV